MSGDPFNPYLASQGQPPVGTSQPPADGRLSGFAKGMVIASLVFCCLRIPLLVLSCLGLVMLLREDPNNPIMKYVALEIGSAAGMAIFGVTGNILLLMGKRLGILFGWLLAACTVGSLIVGVLESDLQFQQFAPGSPERTGAWIGLGVVLAFRVSLLVMYVVALRIASRVLPSAGTSGQLTQHSSEF
ncbi:MAG: hypothetical protein KDA91_12015 [Planctomycetaceae bacterium]|nr:hypothetical protein [Planctomycetaceae bacterium]